MRPIHTHRHVMQPDVVGGGDRPQAQPERIKLQGGADTCPIDPCLGRD